MDGSTADRLENDLIQIMTDSEASSAGENTPPYMIFVVVFLFFVTGLLGFLICHLLKKKGYRCRTGDMDNEDEDEKVGGNTDEEDEENQDTVEQILKCIIENEANMEAFNEMLGNHNVCVRHDPRLRKESIGGVPPHHHTVHSGTDHNSCHLCAQVQSKKGRRQSRTPRFRQRPGEQTVFSVGRFRVTHNDKKLHGGPNPLVSSGDQLDQSQDSEEQKEGGYNLRSMFKDVRTSSEGANGVVPNVGKRRKSVTIFGLRRGSETVGIKEVAGTGREAGGVQFAIQKEPVLLEELVQAQNIETASECGTKWGSTPGTEPSQTEMPAPLQSDMVSSPLSIKEEKQARIPNTEEKTEKKMVGILKTAELLPVEGGVKGLVLSFPSDPVHKDGLSSLQPSPSSPLSTAALGGSRISSMTIFKASPDSKREFSVVTMMEDEEYTSLTKDQKRETCKEKEEMVEMEDIKDCKVMQLQEAEREREEVEKTVDAQLIQD
ncbi:unnamed protein product [Pleuronectes platessa]|uniref:RELT-like protein 2 n=1 Tax=Pleuronectes platessa TaxID=8262 RepID=A0A9N7TV67_PLEPL|nr:unnamed protein product [Pleuronectes platessa]